LHGHVVHLVGFYKVGH